MFNINTGLSKLPKQEQVLSLFEQKRAFKKKSFSVLSFFITVFSAILCLPNTALTGQCVTIPVSPVKISGQPYISTFSNINLNGSGSTAATALPGSSVSISFDQVMNFSGQYCPGCVTFHQVGVGGTTTAISCLKGIRPSRSQNFNTTFTAPNTPGVYYITMYNTLDYQCNTINYSNDPSSALAVLIVTPPSPITISGQPYISTFTNVKVNNGTNGAIVNPGSSVSISFDQVMNFSGQYCPGCVTFHQVGVGGTTTAISCLKGIRPSRSQNFNTTFTAPNTPGVYYITMYNTLDYQCNTINYSNDPSAALAVIVVKDVTPPTISCPANIIKNADQGVCSASVSFSPATATDDCSATVSQTGGLASGSTFSGGTSTITYTATDPSNNTSNCSFTVTVKGSKCRGDYYSPAIATKCPTNIYVVSTDKYGTVVTWNERDMFSSVAGYCNLSNRDINVQRTSGYYAGYPFPVNSLTYEEYVATDACGNKSSCSFYVRTSDITVTPATLAVQSGEKVPHVVSNANFALLQNVPNPTDNSTSIVFLLPREQTARLTIVNMAGQVVYRKIIDGQTGYNEVIITKSELHASGIFQYRLDTQDNSATKRMVVTE